MTGSVLWWPALAAGTLLLTVSGLASTTRGFRGRRVPRLGFFPPRHSRPPRWAMVALFIGILLMTLAAGGLSESDGCYFAYFGGAAALSLLVQATVTWRHNHRHLPDTELNALPEETTGPRDN